MNIFPRFVPTMEWDTAAWDIIAREAWLKTIDLKTNQILKYNKKNLKNPYFITRKDAI